MTIHVWVRSIRRVHPRSEGSQVVRSECVLQVRGSLDILEGSFQFRFILDSALGGTRRQEADSEQQVHPRPYGDVEQQLHYHAPELVEMLLWQGRGFRVDLEHVASGWGCCYVPDVKTRLVNSLREVLFHRYLRRSLISVPDPRSKESVLLAARDCHLVELALQLFNDVRNYRRIDVGYFRIVDVPRYGTLLAVYFCVRDA